MKISFVAINYNNADITINYINSVMGIKDSNIYLNKIVVVDNFSGIDDYNHLVMETVGMKNVEVIRSEKNLGYNGGMNLGFEYCSGLKNDYIIAGNNDLFFERSFLQILSNKHYESTSFVVVPDLITIEGIHQNPHSRKSIVKMKKFVTDVYRSNYLFYLILEFLVMKPIRSIRRKKENIDYMCPGVIFLCIGACFLFTQKYFEVCKRLDDSVFLWQEELILAGQLQANGGELFYDNELKVHHMEHATCNRISSKKTFEMTQRSYKIAKKYFAKS